MPRVELPARRILYEEADLLVVDKPAGLVAHATVDPARDHLVAALSRMLVARHGGVGHLAQHNRLDRDTSGAVLFSRSPALDDACGRMFAQRRVEKTYLAIVRESAEHRFPAGDTTLRGYLRVEGGRTRIVRSGGRPALTHVRPLERANDLLLVQARPATGRTHQIRVQLAELGFPILGDALYGGGDPDVKRLLLHALALAFDHPRTRERVHVVAPPPRAFTRRFPGLRA
jgi:RluA family pseudouridine synthase